MGCAGIEKVGEDGGVDDEGKAVFEGVDLMAEFFGPIHRHIYLAIEGVCRVSVFNAEERGALV